MNLKALNLVAGILSSASLLAQNTALRGIIKDKGDLPLAEAHIVLEDSVGIVKYETRSTGDGRYVVEQVAPSTYVVVVHKSGFQASRQNGILVADGKQTFVDVRLKPEGWKPPKKKEEGDARWKWSDAPFARPRCSN